jgi:chemotaxis protein CheD
MNDIYLRPGDYAIGEGECRIRTLLGSCVSMTLWHRARRVGAMSHCLLPRRERPGGSGLDPKYGEDALRLIVSDLDVRGIDPAECEAKLFGGADMFPASGRSAGMHIGRRNGETARELLEGYGIPVVSGSLFGVGHRKIVFDIGTGHVWARQVTPAEYHSAAAGLAK